MGGLTGRLAQPGRFLAGRNLFSRKTLAKDGAAGITLGVESIPDAMASALLAAVNPIFGLHAVMLATPIGALFASSVFMSVQTTSAMSLVVADVPAVHDSGDPAGNLFTLAILTGILMLVLGLLKLGSILRFVSNAVMVGFINGVALLIILGQLGSLTGYASDAGNKLTQTFDLLTHLWQVNFKTLATGLITIALIVLLGKTFLKSFGMVAALIIAAVMVALSNWDSVALVSDVADMPDGLPLPVFPELSNLFDLIVPAFALAFVGLVQGAGVSQNYINPDGKYPDESGDFRGQGVANIAAGLFQGMPVGGSLSATALVKSSGASTRSANIIAGLVIALVVAFFGGAVGRLAMPSLAGLLIVVGFETLKPDEMLQVWRTGAIQKVVLVSTFGSTLIMPLQYAVIIGVILSTVLFVIRQSNRVTVKEWVFDPEELLPVEREPSETLEPGQVIILRPYGSLFYAAASSFEDQLPEATVETRHAVVIINLRGRQELGSTFLDVIERYAEKLRQHESRLVLAEIQSSVYNRLVKTGRIDSFGQENVYRRKIRVAQTIKEAYEDASGWVGQMMADSSEKD